MASGGGTDKVGHVRPTMQMLTWDDKTRPMTRWDMMKFCLDEKNLTDKDKEVLYKTCTLGPLAVFTAGFLGWQAQKLVGWRSMLRKQPHMAPMVPWLKLSFVGVFVSVPFMLVQQWTVDEILKLDEMDSMLAFHVKRFMIVQRNQLMFTRQSAREVTKEEQERLGAASVEQRKANALLASGGSRGTADVNLALQQQVLTPPAQTGYKA
jgi:hypothetical protein